MLHQEYMNLEIIHLVQLQIEIILNQEEAIIVAFREEIEELQILVLTQVVEIVLRREETLEEVEEFKNKKRAENSALFLFI